MPSPLELRACTAYPVPMASLTGRSGPATPLPAISGPLLIDGYSQPGAVPNSHPLSLGLGNNATVLIELDGAAAGGDGLVINAPSLSLVGIHGLSLYRWNNAIHVLGPLDSNQLIGGNLIGLRSDGSAPVPAQGVGVAVFGGHAQIGSGLPADMNVIGGNATGVQLGSISAGSGVLVLGERIAPRQWLGFVVAFEEDFHGGQQADDFLFAHFGNTGEVVVRSGVGIGLADPFLLAQKEPARLGAAEILAAGEGHHVDAHFDEFREVAGRGQLGRGI